MGGLSHSQEPAASWLPGFEGEQDDGRADATAGSGTVLHDAPEREHDRGGDVISLRGVSKSFGSLNVLRNVSFDVPRGEITAVLGPSGTGKSVLLNTIIGRLLNPPYQGTVRLSGSLRAGKVRNYDKWCPGLLPKRVNAIAGLPGNGYRANWPGKVSIYQPTR